MDLSLEAEDANDWLFRGEGADKLVLAYNGTSPNYVGKVIRVEKVSKNESQFESASPVSSDQELLLWTESNAEEIMEEQQSLQSVMVSLLGSEFADAGVCVPASKDFLESVERNVLHQRPLWRVHAAKINTASNSVHLMSDHSVFPSGNPTAAPCISIEIKPKCGFLPSSEFIAEQNAIKQKVSRFQMHQALKLQEGQISQLSEYDPLDLFSGSRERVHKALLALFVTPQNNLRVFIDGSIVYGSMGGGSSTNLVDMNTVENQLRGFMQQASVGDGLPVTNLVDMNAFENHLRGFMQQASGGDGHPVTSFIDLVAETLLKSGVMERLLQVQKLDSYDIEGAIHAYYNIVSQPCLACRGFEEEGMKQELRRCTRLHSISLEESVKIVKDYLISATANDCSLMISFCAKEKGDSLDYSSLGSGSVYLKSTDQTFEYKACFIDLDIKPLKKMEHYYRLDQKIVSAYGRMMNQENHRDTVLPD